MMVQYGWTPVQNASRAGNVFVVELLKNKANLHHTNMVCMGSMFEGEQCMCCGILGCMVFATEGWF